MAIKINSLIIYKVNNIALLVIDRMIIKTTTETLLRFHYFENFTTIIKLSQPTASH